MSEDTRIQDALKRFGFQTTTATITESQVRLTLRVPVNAAEQWKLCMWLLLDKSEDYSWTVDPSRKYFLRGQRPNRKLFYIWRLIFQGPRTEDFIPEVVAVIISTPKAKSEVMEIQLAGARTHSSRGKGASSISGDEGVPAIAQMALGRLRGS